MICSKCGKEKRLVPAGTSKKTGKPYDEFWSCTRECKEGQVTYTAPERAPEDTSGAIVVEVLEEIKEVIGNQTLAIDAVNERLDKMGKWIKDNVK